MRKQVLMSTAALGLIAAGTALPVMAQTAPTATPSPTPSASNAKPIRPLYRNIRPFYRNIRAFWGDVNPFYRNIRAFWGDVDPFYRNIRAFWGSVDPITNARIAGAPDYTAVAPFWETLGSQWDGISQSWQTAGTYDANRDAYSAIGQKLNLLVDTSEATWGAAVSARTGKSFDEGFANPLFAKFGINPNDPASLARLSAAEQSHLFIDWYDGLMAYSGTDHADHWMGTINWTPRLTQVQGGGSDAVIGLVDFFVAGDDDIKSKVIYSGGESTFSTGHGAGVGSLIVASHDGKGIMGIAPKAKVAAYNPFDATGTADWASVSRGIRAVTSRGAAVVNLSLGVPGTILSPEWRHVFKANDGVKDQTIYVIAAGNDGITQAGNIEMKDGLDSTFLVVGSVDPSGRISDFSNRPGYACLVQDGQCKDDPSKPLNDQLKEGSLLMRRFIVAPGELILVSDDNGGVTRQSGTSLAAPLVAGAIALIHDRWPWMKKQPRAVAEMILRSAKDLGAPGIDPVYGVGLLDVEAAQSPLNFGNLKFYFVDGNRTTEQKVSTVVSTGVKSTWEAKGVYFSAFEKVESAERDFLIPLSSRLIGTVSNGQYFQDYLYDRMTAWMAGTTFAPSRVELGFANAGQRSMAGADAGWTFSVAGRMTNPYAVQFAGQRIRIKSTFFAQSPDQRSGFAYGYGDAAMALGSSGFNLASDYDPHTGGANPLIGFASGGSHVAVTSALGEAVQMSFGYTENRQSRANDFAVLGRGTSRDVLGSLDPYRAEALNVRLDYKLRPGVTFSATASHLNEPQAMLGIRSIQPSDFNGGATTAGLTIGTHFDAGAGFNLAVSATGTRTASDRAAALRAGAAGLLGSAYQVAIGKTGIATGSDHLRLSVAQPLTIERGSLDFESVQVIDRETGEIGVVTQRIGMPAQARRMIIEANYGSTAFDGVARISAFGRAEVGAVQNGTPRFMFGGETSLAF